MMLGRNTVISIFMYVIMSCILWLASTICCVQYTGVTFERLCPVGESLREGRLLGTVSAAGSHMECCTACASIQQCVASMMTGDVCHLYATYWCNTSLTDNKQIAFRKKPSCDPDMVQLYPNLPSVYSLGILEWPTTVFEAYEKCTAQNAHLVAINSATEQAAMKDLIQGSGCDLTWTGGITSSIGSRTMTDWSWNMTTHGEGATYEAWGANQPDGQHGLDITIALFAGLNYQWVDYPSIPDPFSSVWLHCYVCECRIWD